MSEYPDVLSEAVYAEIDQQMAHLRWHGDALDHWHVGVTALDGPGRFTEQITRLYGVPVHRLLEIGRTDIRAVSRSKSSCHPDSA